MTVLWWRYHRIRSRRLTVLWVSARCTVRFLAREAPGNGLHLFKSFNSSPKLIPACWSLGLYHPTVIPFLGSSFRPFGRMLDSERHHGDHFRELQQLAVLRRIKQSILTKVCKVSMLVIWATRHQDNANSKSVRYWSARFQEWIKQFSKFPEIKPQMAGSRMSRAKDKSLSDKSRRSRRAPWHKQKLSFQNDIN